MAEEKEPERKKLSLQGNKKLSLGSGQDFIKRNFFFGEGLGYKSSIGQSSSLNWYLFLWEEAGLITLLPLLLFFFMTIILILDSNLDCKMPILFGIIAGMVHFLFISTFHNPPIWILLAIFYSVIYNPKYIK